MIDDIKEIMNVYNVGYHEALMIHRTKKMMTDSNRKFQLCEECGWVYDEKIMNSHDNGEFMQYFCEHCWVSLFHR